MTPEQDGNQLGQLWAWAMGAIGLGAAWLWNHTMGRIQRLEDTKVSKEDFSAHVSRSDKSREELRDNQIALFARMDKQDVMLARIEGKLDR